MKITIEQLEKINACKAAINRFYNTKELHDIDITNITEITVADRSLFDDISWLQSKLKNHFKLRKLTYVNSDGYSVTFTYDERGNKLTSVDSNGYIETYTYDERGNLLTYTDSNGNSATYTYDEKYDLTGFVTK